VPMVFRIVLVSKFRRL